MQGARLLIVAGFGSLQVYIAPIYKNMLYAIAERSGTFSDSFILVLLPIAVVLGTYVLLLGERDVQSKVDDIRKRAHFLQQTLQIDQMSLIPPMPKVVLMLELLAHTAVALWSILVIISLLVVTEIIR